MLYEVLHGKISYLRDLKIESSNYKSERKINSIYKIPEYARTFLRPSKNPSNSISEVLTQYQHSTTSNGIEYRKK